MSFSSDLKTELGAIFDAPRHCRVAELAAIVMLLSEAPTDHAGLRLRSANILPLEAAVFLIKRLFNETVEIQEESLSGTNRFFLDFSDQEWSRTLKCRSDSKGRLLPDTALLTNKSCCMRSFVRGAFLSAGTISDPNRSYQMEINCKTPEQAQRIQEVLQRLHLDAGLAKRNRYYSVYLKDGDKISDTLGLMGARVALLELENRRILRSMRGTVNRKVNCETANIGKTAEASARQIEAIQLIISTGNRALLSGGLDEVARLRVEYPEATLSELALKMDPPVGRSGMNHRLRKICVIADRLKDGLPKTTE